MFDLDQLEDKVVYKGVKEHKTEKVDKLLFALDSTLFYDSRKLVLDGTVVAVSTSECAVELPL
mgnify:CR=1 FL=1